MSLLTLDVFQSCVAESGLAPSVHNTQPALWRRLDGDAMELSCDVKTSVPVADPNGHDLLLSCGTALEGMVIALSRHGLATEVTLVSDRIDGAPVARLQVSGQTTADPLCGAVEKRFTCRAGFAAFNEADVAALSKWALTQGDVHLVTDRSRISEIARLNDDLSAELFRNGSFRRELLNWCRLTPKHPRWPYDGLNADAMSLGRWEARFMPLALSAPIFGLLNRLGMARDLSAERKKTESAAAVLFLSVPASATPVLAGRRYYRMCLSLAELGFSTWPMSVLVDQEESQAAFRREFALAGTDRLVSCLRVGRPDAARPKRARRPIAEIIR